MRRLSVSTAAVLVCLAWSTLAIVNGGRISRTEHGAKLEKPRLDAKARVTIVFRGLMVLHPDPARKYFEAGILPAPGHKLRIEVLQKSVAGVSSFEVTPEILQAAENDVWSLEFANSGRRGINLYKNGAFDRKTGVGDVKDFRWAVDLEGKEFYNQELTTRQHQFGPVLRVTSGEFYTKTRTAPLLRNRGNGNYEYFGSAADEIAADLFEAGDVVLRSAKSGKEILRLNDKPGTTYEIVVENQPMTDVHASGGHFSYYYRLITKPRQQWYDFRVADDALLTTNHHANSMVKYVPPGSTRLPCMSAGVGKRTHSLK
jgi:hypothetical protein